MFGAVDFVVEGGKRDGQVFGFTCGRMQGRAQAECHEHHQPNDGGEQQLPRGLPLSMLVEHLVDPAGRQRMFQRRAGHQARRRILLEPRNDGRPERIGALQCF
jgi:hypothetical protein